jgi:hypothetical protein
VARMVNSSLRSQARHKSVSPYPLINLNLPKKNQRAIVFEIVRFSLTHNSSKMQPCGDGPAAEAGNDWVRLYMC